MRKKGTGTIFSKKRDLAKREGWQNCPSSWKFLISNIFKTIALFLLLIINYPPRITFRGGVIFLARALQEPTKKGGDRVAALGCRPFAPKWVTVNLL
jgi:hypothetical protein